MLKHFIKIRQPRSKDDFVSLWRRNRGCIKRRNELDKYYAKRKVESKPTATRMRDVAKNV